jgi:anaerobic dimethyl sulfoxide reductase subunit A
MEIYVRLDKNIIPGCVLLYQGQWTILDKHGVEKAGCANTLASNTPTLPSKGSRSHSIFVEVEKI